MATPSPLNTAQGRFLQNQQSTGNYAQNTQGPVQDFANLQNTPFGAMGLANRAAVPAGRSMNDIGRIAEQQRRRGNIRPMMQLGMMSQQQNFAREMDATNFDQSKQMFGMQQQAMDARDQTQRGWMQQDWQRNQTEAQRMEDVRRQWDMTQYGIKLGDQAMEQERQRQQAELDRQRVPITGQIAVPGTSYTMPYADGKVMSTLPMQQAAPTPKMQALPGTNLQVPMMGNDRIPGMPLFEAQPNPGWSVKGQPKETLAPLGGASIPKIQHFEKDGVKVPHEYNPKTGRWRPVQFEDANGNGIDDKKEQAAPATPGAAAGAAWMGLGGR